MNEELKNFTEGFFTNLGATVKYQNEIMIIENVPKSFESLYGKIAPYYVVFEDIKNPQYEVMVAGSFLLSCMKEYLEHLGQTSLVKLDLEVDSKEVINENFNFRNSSIIRIDKKLDYAGFLRFTFLTTFQYINEKEQVMNEIYVDNDKVIDFDISLYRIREGKKEDISMKDIKNQYSLAKERLKILLEYKINKISEVLDNKLKKEIERVKNHFFNQKKEIQDIIDKNNQQIKDLEQQSSKMVLDSDSINIKIKKLKETNELLVKDNFEKIKKEEEFFLNDETHKHSLNLSNKLMNTSIVYYPVYNFEVFLKNPETMKLIQLKYNPIENKMGSLSCENCKSEIKDIYLCSSGHVSCFKCLRKCEECHKEFCSKCLTSSCFLCEKKLCKKCGRKCISCGKLKCLTHMKNLSTCVTCYDKKAR